MEIDTLLTTITDAVDLAEKGDSALGYEALLAGLRRAEALRDAGEPWGDELVRCWQTALDRFAEWHWIGRARAEGMGSLSQGTFTSEAASKEVK